MLKIDASLERKLARARVVSFDVFDTAIIRQLDDPKSLFDLMAPRVRGLLGEKSAEFPAFRIFAENAARLRHPAGPREVRLAEIYEVFCELVDLDPAGVEELCRLEVEIELTICCPNPAVQAIYRRCLEQEKTVLFISDMYLSEEVVGKILQQCGYSKYQALFVSSETRKTKASGQLYEEALRRIPMKPKQWLHIGDNRVSDVRMARKRGLMTWHCLSPAERLKQDTRQLEAWRPDRLLSTTGYVVKGLLGNRLAYRSAFAHANGVEHGFWEDFGYSVAGPLYAGFTEWLIEQATRSRPDAIQFLARDGYLVQRLFEAYRPPELSGIETRYLYASRRALNIATIEKVDESSLRFLAQSFSLNNVDAFLRRLGLDPRLYLSDIQRAGFRNGSQIVKTRTDLERLRALLKALEEPICARARSERETILDYLGESGFSEGRRIAMVDIGWQGSQQRAIQKLLAEEGRSVDITGWFLGSFWFGGNLFGERLPKHEAYLFRRGQPREYQSVVLYSVEICELLFSAPEGSLIRMERLPAGGFMPLLHPVDGDEAIRNGIVEKIQTGVQQFADDYFSIKKNFPELRIDPEIAINQLRRVLANPAAEEAKRLGAIPHTKDFGESTRGPIARASSLLQLLAPRRIIRLREGTWRPGIEARSSRLYRLLYRLRMGDLI